MLEGLIVGLILLVITWVAPKVWVKIQGPIDHLEEQMTSWSTEDRKMISDAGYDLNNLVWVIRREISNSKARGSKPVLIGWWLFKREVHLPRKGEGEFAQLFEKP